MEWYALSYQLQLYSWRPSYHEEGRGDTYDKESLWTLTDEKVYKWCGYHDVHRLRDGIGLPAANIDAEGDHGAYEGTELENSSEGSQLITLTFRQGITHDFSACTDHKKPVDMPLRAPARIIE